MPTLEERGVELALDVSQLRERLALRRADQWWARRPARRRIENAIGKG